MSNPPAAFSGALKTTSLIGRQPQLSTISEQILHPSLGHAFRCVLITADGGKGKTRLLQEVEQIYSPPDPTHPVIVLPLIDLADPSLHGVVAFLSLIRNALAQKLPPSDLALLQPFDEANAQYEQAHISDAMISKIGEANDSLIKVFQHVYQQITAGRRVVWMLDTMEQLFTTPPEIEDLIRYDYSINLNEIGPTTYHTYHWLLRFIIARNPNTTLLLAGRPHPGRWVIGIRSALQQSDVASIPTDEDLSLAEPSPIIDIIDLSVEDFSVEEALIYLDTLQEQMDQYPSLSEQTEFLADLRQSEEDLQRLYLLTNGNPIRLALYIDLLVSGGVFPEPFRTPLADLQQMVDQNPAASAQLLNSINDDLLTYIARELGGTLSQVLGYLSITRRGLDQQRLAKIWGTSQEEAALTLAQLRLLSFIKHRPDGRYFLHDELYQIYQQEFTRRDQQECQSRRSNERTIYRKLIEFCQVELREQNQAILHVQVRPHSPIQPDHADLRARRIRRRQIQAEWLHYSLYLDPCQAFYEVYFALSEQAFTTNDFELDSLLQSEIDGFFFGGAADLNRLQTGLSVAEWDELRFVVLHERVSSWIKRLTRAGLRSQAQTLAEDAQRDHAKLVRQYYDEPSCHTMLALYDQPSGELIANVFLREWQACAQFAAISRGGREARVAILQLQHLIADFEALMRNQPVADLPEAGLNLVVSAFRNRLLNILAQCIMYVGYGNVTLNAFTQAISSYRQASYLLVHAQPRLETLLAEVKNNLSRVLGELGQLDDAIAICDEGAAINQRLGLDYSLAISYNTKALIYTTNQRPASGLPFAHRALSLFRQRFDLRGIGLALIQAGEGRRRSWWIEAEQHMGLVPANLQDDPTVDPERDLRNAIEIFKHIQEPLRLMESYSALACLYRDRASYLGQPADGADFCRALECFDMAREIAQQKGFASHELAILADRAWLYKRAGRYVGSDDSTEYYNQAERIAVEALMIAPPVMQISCERPLDIAAIKQQIGFLRELSKLSALRADVAAEQGYHLERSIEQRILAIIYLQIIMPTNDYLAQNKRKLYTLLSQAYLTNPGIRVQVEQQAEQIAQTYHFQSIEKEIGPLVYRQVLADLFARPDGIDYV